MKKRRKIDWQKLINGEYSLSIRLQVFLWMLRTGAPFNPPKKNWSQDGINKLLFNYSANNNDCLHPLGDNVQEKLSVAFVQAIVKTPADWVAKWREKERIGLGKSRYLTFDEGYPTKKVGINLYWDLKHFGKYKGLALNGDIERFQRTGGSNPYIHGVIFTCNAYSGFQVRVNWTIHEHPGGGWTDSIYQEEGEPIAIFADRAHQVIKGWLLPNPPTFKKHYRFHLPNKAEKQEVINGLRDLNVQYLHTGLVSDYIIVHPTCRDRSEWRYVDKETYDQLLFPFEDSYSGVFQFDVPRLKREQEQYEKWLKHE